MMTLRPGLPSRLPGRHADGGGLVVLLWAAEVRSALAATAFPRLAAKILDIVFTEFSVIRAPVC
jgi:hypothetical protein